jgi:polyphosphate kinase
VRVVSIVGRFLEHARIYYFRNRGAEEYFIGSADSMNRNLESRVEALVPVDDPHERQTLRAILDLQLAPNRNAWRMQSDGSYIKDSAAADDRGCQQALFDWLADRDSIPQPGRSRKRRAARRATALLPG